MPLLEPTRRPSLSDPCESSTSPKIKVLVCTANIGNEAPDDASIAEWIPKDGVAKTVLENQPYPLRTKQTRFASCVVEPIDESENNARGKNGSDEDGEIFHIIAIGMQEATFELEETKKLGRKPSYTRGVSYQRGQMRLMIFFRKDEISLDVLSVKAQNTGRGGLANKGGIVAECDINSGTRISFLTAHLEAHEGLVKYNTRCSTIGDIFRGTTSSLVDSYCDVSITSHFMFAMGDLNFRTRLPNHEIGSEDHLKEAHALAKKKDWDSLNEYDELALALRDKECLVGFSTPRCDFPPTFKVERKDGYSYISKRSPSYTDRILYKASHNLSQNIELLAYEPIDHFTTSDHKPIRAAFEVQLNQRLSFRPILTKRHGSSRHLGSTPVFVKKLRRMIGKRDSFLESNLNARVHSENFHFFLSSIGCEISGDVFPSSTYKPSPCVSFISTPSNAMLVNTFQKDWKSWYRKNSVRLGITDVKGSRAIEWPHTEAITDTLDPQWEKEINFKIRTHLPCGAPVDLTGAMLHILVHDTKDKLNVLGTCSLNIASLVIGSRENENSHGISSNVKKTSLNSSTGFSPALFAARWLQKNRNKNVPKGTKIKCPREGEELSRRGPTDAPENDLSSGPSNSSNVSSIIQSTNLSSVVSPVVSMGSFGQPFEGGGQLVDESLMKNGKQVGRIRFNMDTWWLNDDDFAGLSTRRLRN